MVILTDTQRRLFKNDLRFLFSFLLSLFLANLKNAAWFAAGMGKLDKCKLAGVLTVDVQ